MSGCAAPSKLSAPTNLPALNAEKARIIVTREKQLSGMTTPIYIVDIGRHTEANGEISVRVGDWVEEPGLSLWYLPGMMGPFSTGMFTLMPTSNIRFAEMDLTLEDLLEQNQNAIIYVDYLSCQQESMATLHCSDGKAECSGAFIQELENNNGTILATDAANPARRDVQVIGKLVSGGMLVWDRAPGLMRIGSLWGAFNLVDDTLALTRGNIIVEAGKTYYLHYEISLGDQIKRGDRWTITGVE